MKINKLTASFGKLENGTLKKNARGESFYTVRVLERARGIESCGGVAVFAPDVTDKHCGRIAVYVFLHRLMYKQDLVVVERALDLDRGLSDTRSAVLRIAAAELAALSTEKKQKYEYEYTYAYVYYCVAASLEKFDELVPFRVRA